MTQETRDDVQGEKQVSFADPTAVWAGISAGGSSISSGFIDWVISLRIRTKEFVLARSDSVKRRNMADAVHLTSIEES